MIFLYKRFDYMPPGSFAVQPDGSPVFLTEVPDELKNRLIEDLKKQQAEREEKNERPAFFRLLMAAAMLVSY
ncbi:MAG: hypothetical protein QM308_06390 [Bacillota bacterium]|nr:hypothetical protein [Bacillota bacterium]